MVKEKRILSYFIGWLLLGFIICFIGVNKIFANTTGFWGPKTTQPSQAYFYDCTSSGCNSITTSTNGIGYDGSNNQYGIYWTNLTTVAGSYGGMAAIRTSTPLLADKIYSTTIYMCTGSSYIVPKNLYSGSLANIQSKSYPVNQLTGWGNADLGYEYPYQRIELGGGIANPVINNCRAVSFIYTPKVNSNFIGFNFTTGNTVTTNQYLIGYDHEYLGDSNNLSEEQVDTIINNQTNEINTSINNMQENIYSDIKDTETNINQNIDNMQDNIINNQNDIAEKQEEIQEVCRIINKDNIIIKDKKLNFDGTFANSSSYGITDYIKIGKTNERTLGSGGTSAYLCWYDSNKNLISCNTLASIPKGDLSIPENALYFRTSIEVVANVPQFKICNNGNQAVTDTLDETNDKLDNLQGALTDSSAPNTSGLENSAGWLPSGPLDSVLNLPLSLFNALTTNLNKSCKSINIPLPYVNKNITLPCINTLYNQIGITSFLSWIGVIVSGLMLYTYLLKLYKWIEDRISLNETHNVDSWGGL